MKLTTSEWESWFAWRPVRVHDQVAEEYRDSLRDFPKEEIAVNPYGPNEPNNVYWLCWLERRKCCGAYDGAKIWSSFVYRLPKEVVDA